MTSYVILLLVLCDFSKFSLLIIRTILRFYDMGNSQNAFSVFSAQRRKDADPLNLTRYAYRTSNAIFLIHGRYYCAACFWFHDSKGPSSSKNEESNLILPDFSIDALGHKMSIVRGEDRVATLRMALKSLGGIETFIEKGDRVLLKANAARKRHHASLRSVPLVSIPFSGSNNNGNGGCRQRRRVLQKSEIPDKLFPFPYPNVSVNSQKTVDVI